jgi:hypothetical protein
MPPKDLDEPLDMDADSSAAPALDENAAAPVAEAAPADSSAATDETEADTLSVVRDVVEAREEAPAEAAPSAEGEEGERNELRGDSVEYRKITSYLETNGLSAGEAADGLEVMALMKLGDPRAWELLKPRVQNLLIAIGEVLPDDLAKKVDAKEMTREAAMEVSKARASLKTQEVRQKFNEQQGQRRQQQEMGASLTTAAATWGKRPSAQRPELRSQVAPHSGKTRLPAQREARAPDRCRRRHGPTQGRLRRGQQGVQSSCCRCTRPRRPSRHASSKASHNPDPRWPGRSKRASRQEADDHDRDRACQRQSFGRERLIRG